MFYPPACPGYTPAGYDPPFTPRYSVPESFRRALSYEGQLHWLAGVCRDLSLSLDSFNDIWIADTTGFTAYEADSFVDTTHTFDVTWPDMPIEKPVLSDGDLVFLRFEDTSDNCTCLIVGYLVDADRAIEPERWNVAVKAVLHNVGDALKGLKADVASLKTGQAGLQKRVSVNESAIDALSNNTDYSSVYIATYGSDSNDGLTRDTPVKTLSHAFEVARGVLNPSNLEFVILNNSTYTATIGCLCNKSIHIVAELGATVDIHSKSGTRIPVYNCYLDFAGRSDSTRLVVNFSTGFHMDSTFLWSQYATFKVSGGKFDVQGGAIRLENCILDSTETLVLNSSNAAFVNTDVRCTPTQYAIIGQGSLVMFQACTFTNPKSKALALVMTGCFVSLVRASHYVGTMPSAGFLSLNTSHAVMQKDFKESIPDFAVKGYSSSICKSASLFVME